MTKKRHTHRKPPQKKRHSPSSRIQQENDTQQSSKKLEIVLKCDSVGSREAVLESLAKIGHPDVSVKAIFTGLGPVNKTDLLMATTGSRLVLGFNVNVSPGIDKKSKEDNVEIRLYDVIYKLTNDVRALADTFIPLQKEERILGKAKIVALFKAGKKGIILGCEVLEGSLALGSNFRVISAMGPIYSGRIESLHIEKDAVKEARSGQQVGIKIQRFKGAKLGDLVETYEGVQPTGSGPWYPRGGILYS